MFAAVWCVCGCVETPSLSDVFHTSTHVTRAQRNLAFEYAICLTWRSALPVRGMSPDSTPRRRLHLQQVLQDGVDVRLSLVPMKLVSRSPSTLLKTVEIRGLQPTSRHGSQAGSSQLPLEARCFEEGDRSLRDHSRRIKRRGCTWLRRFPHELFNTTNKVAVHW